MQSSLQNKTYDAAGGRVIQNFPKGQKHGIIDPETIIKLRNNEFEAQDQIKKTVRPKNYSRLDRSYSQIDSGTIQTSVIDGDRIPQNILEEYDYENSRDFSQRPSDKDQRSQGNTGLFLPLDFQETKPVLRKTQTQQIPESNSSENRHLLVPERYFTPGPGNQPARRKGSEVLDLKSPQNLEVTNLQVSQNTGSIDPKIANMNSTDGFYSTGDATNFLNQKRRKSVNFRGLEAGINPQITVNNDQGVSIFQRPKSQHQIDRASSFNVLDEGNLFKNQEKGLSLMDSFSPIKQPASAQKTNAKKLLSGILEEPNTHRKQLSEDTNPESIQIAESDTKLYEITKLLSKWESKMSILDREIETEKQGRKMALEDLANLELHRDKLIRKKEILSKEIDEGEEVLREMWIAVDKMTRSMNSILQNANRLEAQLQNPKQHEYLVQASMRQMCQFQLIQNFPRSYPAILLKIQKIAEMGFEDTFSKNNSKNDDLQYDDAASYFFFCCIITVAAIPLFINVCRVWKSKPKFSEKFVKVKTKASLIHLKKATEEFQKRKITGFFKCKIFILIMLGIILLSCLGKASFVKTFQKFDPYEILDVSPTATTKQIKKAYRTLARLLHPDNNPGDPEATTKFQLVNKAMRCLTDPEVMEKCKQFGNPDGSSGFQVGIALPKALLDKKNKMLVLSVFFIIMLIFLPAIVWMWYSDKDKYLQNGVNQISVMQAAHFIQKTTVNLHLIMEMCASSTDLKPIFEAKVGQGVHLKKLSVMFDEQTHLSYAKEKCLFLKPYYMLLAYLNRVPIPKELEEDMRFMHKKIPALLSVYSDLGLDFYRSALQYHREEDKEKAELKQKQNLETYMMIIRFNQLYYQGMMLHQSPFFQIPGVNESNIKKITTKLVKKEFNFQEFFSNESKIEKLLESLDSDADRELAKQTIQAFPRMQAKVDIFVDEVKDKKDDNMIEKIEKEEKLPTQEEILARNRKLHQGDLITLEVTLTDLSIPETREDGYYFVGSQFPYQKFATWNVFLLNPQNKIMEFRPIVVKKRTVVEKFILPMHSTGSCLIKVLVKPDCYVDLDILQEISFSVEGKRPDEEYKLHEDDDEARKKPTLFNQLRAQLMEENSDEELEENEQDDEKKDEKGGSSEEEEEEEKQGADESSKKTKLDGPKIKVEQNQLIPKNAKF